MLYDFIVTSQIRINYGLLCEMNHFDYFELAMGEIDPTSNTLDLQTIGALMKWHQPN